MAKSIHTPDGKKPPRQAATSNGKGRSRRRSNSPAAAIKVSDDAEGRASKRVRQQLQSLSPPSVIPAIMRHPVVKTPEDKILVFRKGEFLALRNGTGSFFVCQTAQIVYKSSKRFKILWMNDKEPDIYIPDFYEKIDSECVLTNLRMNYLDKKTFQLPSDERQRTLNILQRALNVENAGNSNQVEILGPSNDDAEETSGPRLKKFKTGDITVSVWCSDKPSTSSQAEQYLCRVLVEGGSASVVDVKFNSNKEEPTIIVKTA